MGVETIGRAIVKVLLDATGAGDDLERQIRREAKDIGAAGEAVSKEFHSGFRRRSAKETEAHLLELRDRLERRANLFERVGDKIGRAFGRGSRNDFLNAFGGFVSIGPRILETLTKLQYGFVGLRQRVNEMVQDGATLRQSLMSLAKQGLPGLIAAAGALAVALQLTLTLMGPVGAGISLLTGLVLALAGSLGFALVGALTAVAGALVPFAVGIGVAALAISGLDSKSKALKSLKETFQDLQKTAARGLFGKDGAGLANLEPVLRAVEPLVKTVSTALGGLLTQLGEIGKNKAFVSMLAGVNAIIGPMVTTLGQIGGKLALGIGQAFVAAGPIIQKFLGWLDGVMNKFIELGKGGEKSDLADFFDRAWTSAQKVGRLIGTLITLVGQLFSAGKGTGDSIFESIANKVQEIVEWLSKPEGQKALAQWFSDAERLAGALGGVVTKVIEFVDTLDTPANREALIRIVGAAETLIGVLSVLVGWAQRMNIAFLTAVAEILNGVNTWISDMAEKVGTFFTVTLPGFFSGVGAALAPLWNGIVTFVTGFINGIKKTFLELYNYLVGNSLIPDLIMAIVGWFAKLPGMIIGVLGNLTLKFGAWLIGLPGEAAKVIPLIVATFAGLAGKIISGAGDIAGKFGTWISSLPGKAATNAANIAKAYSGLASDIIKKAGDLGARFASWVSGVPGRAERNANAIESAYSGVAAGAVKKMGSLSGALDSWGQSAVNKANSIANGIVNQFDGLGGDIASAIGPINVHVNVDTSEVTRAKNMAAGGLVNGPSFRVIGEAGPEAVVPLSRNLSMVDPAVRALSAIAQGLPIPKGSELPNGLPGGGGGMSVTIITPTEDPRAVAAEVFARFAGGSYI